MHCQLSAALPEQMGRCKIVTVRDIKTVQCQPCFPHKVSYSSGKELSTFIKHFRGFLISLKHFDFTILNRWQKWSERVCCGEAESSDGAKGILWRELKNEKMSNEGPASLTHLLLHFFCICVPFFSLVKSTRSINT